MLKGEDVMKPVTEIMETIGGIKEVWEAVTEGQQQGAEGGKEEEEKYAQIKKRYRRLIKLEGGIKDLVMEKEEDKKMRSTGKEEAGEGGGESAMDVQEEGEEGESQQQTHPHDRVNGGSS